MKDAHLAVCKWMLLVAVSCTAAVDNRAETNLTVLTMTNVWRYNQWTNVDGTGWEQPGYDDSGWAEGPGAFGFEDNPAIVPLILTPLQASRSYDPPGHAVYFRGRFQMPENRVGAVLYFTNRIDDGAAFYLNGVRVLDVRMNPGPGGFTTLATGPPPGADAVADELLTLVPTNLVSGENVLAVSLHNSDTNSNDHVFGCAVTGFIPDPLIITNQPQSQTVEANGSVSFSVGVSGSRPRFQWYRNESPLPNATNASYSIALVQTSHAGEYKVVVTNTANNVTSSVAILTVTADTTAPVLLRAVAMQPTPPTRIILTFNESIAISASDVLNYSVTDLGANTNLTVAMAQRQGERVQLTLLENVPLSNHMVSVTNVTDTAGNPVAPNTRIGVLFWRELLPRDARWNWSEGFDLTGQDWMTAGYDELTNNIASGGQWRIPNPAWDPVGRGIFYFFDFTERMVTPRNTLLSIGHPTYYFRARFNAPAGASMTWLRFSCVIDDGAVFYLNGAEVYRHNMPAGTPNYQTRAITMKDRWINWTVTPDLLVTNLRTGTNVIAVEVHPFDVAAGYDEYQGLRYESGIAFGAGLDVALAPRLPDGGVLRSSGDVTTATAPSLAQFSVSKDAPAPRLALAAPITRAGDGISNVIHISIDGGGSYWMKTYVTNFPGVFSNFHRLRLEGAFTWSARCDAGHSYTIPNHTCMLLGRPVFQPTNMPNTTHHGYSASICSIPDDGWSLHNAANTNVPYKASVFDVVHDHGLSTEFFCGKSARLAVCERSYNATNGAPDELPPDNGRDKIDYAIVADSYAEQLVTLFVQNLYFLSPKTYSFLHFVDLDESGHHDYWGSYRWSNTVWVIDQQIGRLLEAAQNHPSLSNRTVVILTADHGADPDRLNHANARALSTFEVPLAIWGPGIPGGVDLYDLFFNRADPGTNWLDYSALPQPIRNGDSGNLALKLLGLPPIPGSLMIPKFQWEEPKLAVRATNNVLVVSWSGYATNFQLEACAALAPGMSWDVVTQDIVRDAEGFHHASAISTITNRFYRLRRTGPEVETLRATTVGCRGSELR